MLFLDNPNKYKYISIHMQIGTWVQIDIHTDTKVGIYVIGEGGWTRAHNESVAEWVHKGISEKNFIL